MTRSPLANWAPAKRPRWRRMEVHGLCVHTTGRGIVERARRKGVPAIELALEWYRSALRSGVHYVLDYDGTLYQMLDDDRRGAHVGISGKERRAYLSGRWRRELPKEAQMWWLRRWGEHGFRSPQHIYPTKSPNGCYIGLEMLPLPQKGKDGYWFTPEQHEAVAALWGDIQSRYSLDDKPGRLIGHEDIDGYARWDKRGGWDPGAMRGWPRFDWSRI